MENQIDDILRKIIIKNLRLRVQESDIEENTNIIKTFSIDSLQLVKIISDIEAKFGLEFLSDDEVLDAFRSFKNLKAFVENRKITI